jgi:hypothetical protein
MPLTKLSLAGNNLIIRGQGKFGKWHPGTEKSVTFFTVYCRKGGQAKFFSLHTTNPQILGLLPI